MSSDCLAAVAAATVPQHFFEVEEWARANRFGVNDVYAMLRCTDPIPHVRRGRRYLIDDELAIGWVRRNFGVNTNQ